MGPDPLFGEIWVITWDHLQGIWDHRPPPGDLLQDQTLWLEWKLTWLMPVITTDQVQKDQGPEGPPPGDMPPGDMPPPPEDDPSAGGDGM